MSDVPEPTFQCTDYQLHCIDQPALIKKLLADKAVLVEALESIAKDGFAKRYADRVAKSALTQLNPTKERTG